MKSRTWMWNTAMCLFAALAITVQTSAQSQMITPAQSQMITPDASAKSKFTTFDAPGSIWTLPTSINPGGAITGYYYAASNLIRGFLRAGNGKFTTFENPGLAFTIPTSINPAGAITGSYRDASFVFHGFLWTH